MEDLVSATGQFRALQVKLIPLYGHDVEIFGHYMAIWRYLKEIRRRMGKAETLYFHDESRHATDAFFMLIDAFRYRVLVQPFVGRAPTLPRPEDAQLTAMRQRGDALHATLFPIAADDATKPT